MSSNSESDWTLNHWRDTRRLNVPFPAGHNGQALTDV